MFLRKAGADERELRYGDGGDRKRLARERCTVTRDGLELFVGRHVEHDSGLEDAIHPRPRSRTPRIGTPLKEVGGAVERIDDPTPGRCAHFGLNSSRQSARGCGLAERVRDEAFPRPGPPVTKSRCS